ncbi:DUF1302 family protein [Hyalangium versicolor]|uniref:DUF1302 family protein n=1 Tax=Hyalangium versicolor TaxID=2861190 RepID=UPI001CCBEA4F|nr:DUF1302 family protein [Hyalangium versicolor]
MLQNIFRLSLLALACGLPLLAGAEDAQDTPAAQPVNSSQDPDLEGMPAPSGDPDLEGMPGPSGETTGTTSVASPRQASGPTASFRGRFRTQANLDLASNRPGEDLVESQSSFELEAALSVSPNFSARLSGRLLLDVRSPERDFGGAARAFFDSELRDAVITLNRGRASLEIGQQVLRWGSTEINSPNDIINPLDLRRGPGVDFEGPVLPIPLVRAAYAGDRAGGELVYVPFFFPTRGYAFGSDWTPLLAAPQLLGLLQQQAQVTKARGAEEALFATNAPSFMPRNGSVGGRAFLRGDGWDARLNLFYGWDRIPEILLTQPALTSTFYRDLGIGVDGSAVLDDFVFRIDARFSTKRTFYTEQLIPFRTRALSWAGGVEFRERFLLELYGVWLPARTAEDAPLLFIDRHQANAAFMYRETFLRDRLKVNVGLQYGLVRKDWVISGLAGYEVHPGHDVEAGVLVLEGKGLSVGGLFDTNDYAFVRYTYGF